MRGLILTYLCVAALMTASAPSYSAEQLSGRVTRIYPQSNGNVYFRLSGTCKTNVYFFFSATGDAGRAWYALLLSAAATKQPVGIAMGAACDPAQDQPISYIYQDF